MQGKHHKKAPYLQVAGFRTVDRDGREGNGRNIVLEWCGGNARDAVHALRDQMKKRNDVEVRGIIIRGLSKRYDIMFELDRETIEGQKKTAVKFSCWRHVEPQQPGPVPKNKPKQKVLYAPTDMPGIWQTGSKFRVRVGKHYVGVYPTFPEAVSAKTLYVARCGSRCGRQAVVCIRHQYPAAIGHSEILAKALVRS